MTILYSRYGTIAYKPTPSLRVVGSTPTLYSTQIQVTCQNPCGSAFRIYILHTRRLTLYVHDHHADGHHIFFVPSLLCIYYYTNYTFSINRQPKLWCLWPYLETSWTRCWKIKVFWKGQDQLV